MNHHTMATLDRRNVRWAGRLEGPPVDYDFAKYYRHEEVVGHLRALADAHPEFVSMSSIGRSFRDRDLRIIVKAMVETLMAANGVLR